MRYLGNKTKIVNDILPIILRDAKPGQVYVEPFVGSAAVISHVPAIYDRRGNDKNPYI